MGGPGGSRTLYLLIANEVFMPAKLQALELQIPPFEAGLPFNSARSPTKSGQTNFLELFLRLSSNKGNSPLKVTLLYRELSLNVN